MTDHKPALKVYPQTNPNQDWQDRHLKNEDIWTEVRNLRENNPMRDILIRWVPSHQTIEDIQRGILTEEDWRGNQEADKLASSAAEANQPSRPEINCYIACREQTIGLQWMLMTTTAKEETSG